MEAQNQDVTRALIRDWRQATLSPREQALCAYAEKLTRAPQTMTQDDLLPLRASGLDDTAIHDLVQVISYFNYINRVADGLGVDLESFMSDPEGPIMEASRRPNPPPATEPP